MEMACVAVVPATVDAAVVAPAGVAPEMGASMVASEMSAWVVATVEPGAGRRREAQDDGHGKTQDDRRGDEASSILLLHESLLDESSC
jgi:hypothetical protein